MAWTLTYGATEKSFDDWGMIGVRRDVDSQGDDVFSFNVATLSCTDDATFPDGAEITVKRDTTTWFVGRRVKNPRLGRPEIEAQSFVFEGPWLYLKRRVFMQTWKSWDNGLGAQVDRFSGVVMLCQANNGTAITTGAQIQEIVEWCRSRNQIQYGAPRLQLDATNLPAINAPFDEVTDITCAEAIRRLLRWSPDSVVWFDYTTSPPTLRIKRRANLTAVSRAIADAEKHESLQLTSREDLVVPSVRLAYRKTTVVDGVALIHTTEDIAPGGATGHEEGVLAQTFNFDGGTVQNIEATLTTEAIAATNLDWWKKREPKLGDRTIYDLSLVAGSAFVDDEENPGGPVLTNEILDGFQDVWMGGEQRYQIAKAKFRVRRYDKDVSGGTTGAKGIGDDVIEVSHRINATSLAGGTYSTSVVSGGEPLPTGLAAQIYSAVSVLHWEGTATFVEEEISDLVTVGQKLNLTGGRAEWATMNALVQSVSYDLDAGRTTVSIGPAPFLGAGDLIELLAANRERQIRTALAIRSNAAAGGGGTVPIGKHMPRASTSPLPVAKSFQRFVTDPANPDLYNGFFAESRVSPGNTEARMMVGTGEDGSPGHQVVAKVGAETSVFEVKLKTNLDKETKVVITATDNNVRLQMTSEEDGAGSIDLNLADCGGKHIAIQEIELCYGGEIKMMRLPCAIYDPPV